MKMTFKQVANRYGLSVAFFLLKRLDLAKKVNDLNKVNSSFAEDIPDYKVFEEIKSTIEINKDKAFDIF